MLADIVKVVIMTTLKHSPSAETVSATEANRNFPAILRGVGEGHSYLITNHGRPVALLSPPPVISAERAAKHQQFMDYLLTLPIHNIGPWTRDELYEDDD